MFLFQTPRHYGRKWEAPRHRGPARAVSPSTWINDRATGCRNPPPPIEAPARHGSNDQPQSVTRGAQSASGAAAGGTAHSRPCTKPRTPTNRRSRRRDCAQPVLHEAQDGPANTLWPAAPPERGEPHWGRKTLIGAGDSPTPMLRCLPQCAKHAPIRAPRGAIRRPRADRASAYGQRPQATDWARPPCGGRAPVPGSGVQGLTRGSTCRKRKSRACGGNTRTPAHPGSPPPSSWSWPGPPAWARR